MASTNNVMATRGESRQRSIRRQQVRKRILVSISLVLFSVFMLFPIYWMLTTSIRDESELFRLNTNPFIIKTFTLSYYGELLRDPLFLAWLRNSAQVAFIASGIAMTLGILAAYSLGRLRYKGGGLAALIVFSTYLIPPAMLFIPMSSVMNFLGLSNKLWALIFTYLTFLVPFISWMLSSYFKGLPTDLVDSALIDGASRMQAMFKIDLPLVLPGIVSVFFFAFTMSWSEYLYAFTLIRDPFTQTIPVGMINEWQVNDIFYWGQLMAGAVVGSVPVVVIYSFLMDYYLAGLTAGAVKG